MDIATSLTYLRPGAQWSLNDNDYDQLTWIGPGECPTEEELKNAWPEAEKSQQNAVAQNARRLAYFLEADPLYFGWQRGENTEQEWLDKVAEIRARHPYS